MRGRKVSEGGIRKGRSWKGDYSTRVGGWILGALSIAEREVKFCEWH